MEFEEAIIEYQNVVINFPETKSALDADFMVAFIIEYTKNANSEQRKKMGEIKRISIDSARLFVPKKFIKT